MKSNLSALLAHTVLTALLCFACLALPPPAAAQDVSPCGPGQVLVVERPLGRARCFSILDLWQTEDYSSLGSYDVIRPPADPALVSPLVPGSEDLGAEGCTDSQGQTLGGNPINVATGNKHQADIDYAGPERFPLSLVRHYNSGSPQNVSSLFGPSWSSPLAPRLYGYDSFTLGGITLESVFIENGTGAAVLVSRRSGEPWRRQNGKIEQLGHNADGTWTRVDGTFIHHYRADGQTSRIEHESGETHSYAYDAAKRLTSITHSSGRSLRFSYNTLGLVSTVTDPAGRALRYSYDSQRNLVAVAYPTDDGTISERRYLYQSPYGTWLLTGIVDENGTRFATFNYDGSRRAVSSEHAGGAERFSVAYLGGDSQDVRRSRTTNALGKVTDYAFQRVGGKWRAVDVAGQAKGSCLAANRSYRYDAKGHLDRVTDWEGQVTDYDHDATGNVQRVTRAAGTPVAQTTTMDWHPGIDKPRRVVTDLLETTYDYDPRGRIAQIRQVDRTGVSPGATRTWRVVYQLHPNGVVSRRVVDGPRNDVADTTTFDYDSGGRLLRITNALGHVTQLQNHDAYGRAGRIVWASGLVSDFTYHPRGWLKSRRDLVDGTWRTTTFSHDRAGQLILAEQAGGARLGFSYDGAHRLTRVTDGADGTLSYQFDAASNVTARQIWQATAPATLLQPISPVLAPEPCAPTSPYVLCPRNPALVPVPPPSPTTAEDLLVARQSLEYDALGRVTRLIGGSGQATRLAYDRSDRLTDLHDGRNHRTRLQHDALDRPVATTDAMNGVAQLEYGRDDLLTGARDPNGNATRYTRNGFGEVVRVDSPDTGTTTFQYDTAGNVIRKVDARGVASTFSYDALNRLREARRGADVPETFQYDVARPGQLWRVTDAAGVHEFTHNAAGELTSRRDVVAGRSLATAWTYDPQGRLSRIIYPSGLNIEQRYDATGRVSDIDAWSPSWSRRPVVSVVKRLPFGPPASLHYGNGDIREVERDLDYRPVRLVSGAGLSQTFQYDAAGNITAISDAGSGHHRTYGYDPLDRISQHTGPDGTTSYQYDPNGNRTWKSVGAASFGLSYYAGSNRLGAVAGETRSHDAAGNTTRIGTRYFDYDGANRLWRFRQGTLTTVYSHNAFGERQLKTQGGATRWFVYAGPMLLHENSGVASQDYIYLDGAPVALVRNGALYYIHSDHLGRPQIVSNAVRSRVWQARNDAFDSVLSFNLLGELNLGLPGQYRDVESGIWHNHFRSYDPATGRYLQHDPIGLAGGLNGYVYASGNPVGVVDPLGLEGVDLRRTQLETALAAGEITQEEFGDTLRAEGVGGLLGAGAVTVGACLGAAGTARELAQMAFEELTGIPIGLWSPARGLSNAVKRSLTRTGRRGHVFWSGGRLAEDAARAYAHSNHGIVIGDTVAGKTLAQQTRGLPWAGARHNWQTLSEKFARSASGEVHVFQNARGISVDSIWRQEHSILTKNPKVTGIRYHIVMPDGSTTGVP